MDEGVRGFWLSPQQARLWALGRDGSPYRAQAVVEVTGPLDVERLRRSLASVAKEHEIFRTAFVRPPGLGLPVQVVRESEEPALLVGSDGKEWTDPMEPQALCCRLVPVAPQRHSLVLTAPALLADDATLVLLTRHLAALYGGGEAGEAVSYVQYSQWRRQLLEEGAEEAHAASLLLARPENPGQVLAWSRHNGPDARGGVPRSLAVAMPDAARLGAIAGELGVATEDVLLAVWRLLLDRLGCRAVAVVLTGRGDESLAGCCGPLACSVPCPLQVEPGERFADTAMRTAAWRVQAEEWLDWFAPGEEHLGLEAGFRFRELPGELDSGAGDVSFRLLSVYARYEPLPLELAATWTPAGLSLDLSYAPGLFPEEEMARTAERLAALLAEALSRPEAAVDDLALLGSRELADLTALGMSPAAPFPAKCLHELVVAQAAKAPERTAIIDAAGELTYGELVRRVAGLARCLANRGVAPEVPVGVAARRDAELVVALLAVLGAGGCYVLLDPEMPPRRQQLLIEDAGIRFVVASGELAARAAANGLEVFSHSVLDEEGPAGAEMPRTSRPENLAYVLYTSGSTGAPKGVMVPHSALMSYLHWASGRYAVAAGERSLVSSPASFDLTVTTLFLPLLAGGTVELVPERAGIEGLAVALGRGEPALMKTTPSQLALLDRLSGKAAGGPRSLVVGGEALREEVARPWVSRPGTRVYNEYGPTETTVGITVYEIPTGEAEGAEEAIPIGRPIANARLYVVDARMRPVPWGAPGELLLGGPGLARGYLGSPALTAERFVPDPFTREPGARLFRSGDLARWRADGELLFLGRVDGQLKIRGFRVEPGEVEAALRRHPAVAEAVAVADASDSARLVAYWVARDGRRAAAEEIRAFLSEHLPEYMVPSALVLLDSLPLNRHGKLDRSALPVPGSIRADAVREMVAPSNDLEAVLAGCWAEVLGIGRVGVRDDFFDLGGHSMLAMQMAARISDDFRLEVPLHVLLEARTVVALAETLRRHEAVPGRTDKIAAALAKIRGMSEQDLDTLLAEKRRGEGAVA